MICADIDAQKIEMLQQGKIPIYEPGLEDYVKDGVQAGRLFFTTDLEQAVQEAEVVFIAVGTPAKPSGAADLSFVWQAAQTIGQNLFAYKVVVDKSTVPVQTAAEVRRLIERELRRLGRRVDFDVVSNPEFLREGCAIEDFMKPDRIVVGSNSERAAQVMAELYEHWTAQGYKLVTMDATSAEMTKYAANAFLATKISFINEIANICEGVGADVDKVREGLGLDNRIGPRFLYPGLGYGGSCFPKDVQALMATAKEAGYIPRLLEAVDRINHDQRLRFIAKIRKYFGHDLRDKVLALWGLSFKPDTDDIREAPALTIMEELLPEVAGLRVFCPHGMPEVKRYFNNHRYQGRIFYAESHQDPLENAYLALEGAEALILNTEYKLFRESDPQVIAGRLKQKVVFDGRNVFEPQKMRALGFTYFSIGRP